MRTIYLRLLGWMQRKCTHPPESVAADITEGYSPNMAVQHCNICGAARITHYDGRMKSAWRVPRPEWEIETPPVKSDSQ
jgi:hypothetical protein